jgi:hypothetical protein
MRYYRRSNFPVERANAASPSANVRQTVSTSIGSSGSLALEKKAA